MTTLIVIDQAPYGTWAGREGLDMAFSLAAFDQSVSMLFMGSGVNWLRQSQNAQGIGQKTVEKNLSAAPLFGVERIIAEQAACERFGLSSQNLLAGVEVNPSINDVLDHFERVVFAG